MLGANRQARDLFDLHRVFSSLNEPGESPDSRA